MSVVNPSVDTQPQDGGLAVVSSPSARVAIAGVCSQFPYGFMQLQFSATYTPCVASDVGKPVVGATTTDSGILLSYDNVNRIWYILPDDVATDVFDDNSETVAVTGGTGTGSLSAEGSAGVASTLHTTNMQSVKDFGGFGELVEAACHVLENKPGVAVDLVPVIPSAAGAASAVVFDGSGTAVLTTTNSSPNDDYEVQVYVNKTVADFTAGGGEFRYSVDGGDTWSNVLAVPVSGIYTIPNTGIVLNFSTGTPSMVADDTYYFTTSAPGYDTTALGTALDLLFTKNYHWRVLAVMGRGAGATESAALATFIAGKIEARAQSKYWSWALCQAGVDAADIVAGAESALIGAFTSVSSTRLGVCGHDCEMFSSRVSGRSMRRGMIYPALLRAAEAPIHEDMGRVASGSLKQVSAFYSLEGVKQEGGDFSLTALDSAKFITGIKYEHNNGLFIANGNLMSGEGSDFDMHQMIQVINAACLITHQFLNQLPGENLRTKSDGTIADEDAEALDDQLQTLIDGGIVVPGHAVAAASKIDRTVPLSSTRKLTANVVLGPWAYVKQAEGKVGFSVSVSG